VDKRLLQSLGIKLGLKRWEAWLIFGSLSVIGACAVWLFVLFFELIKIALGR
jgi:hypothetical protein